MLAHFVHHLIMALLIPLLPYIRDEFSLSYTQAGWLVLAYNLAYGINQLPAGWLADRIGPRLVLTVGVTGVAIVGFLIGLSTSYVILALLLALFGLAGGGYHPASAPLVSASVAPQNQGRALGFHQIGGAAGFFLAPLVAAGIAGALDWRGTFLAISIPSIAFGIVFHLRLGRLGDTRQTRPEIPASHTETLPTSGHTRRLVAFLLLGITSMVLINSTLSFIPLFVVDHFGATEEAAAAMLSLAYFGGLWAGPLGGYLSDRLGKVPVMMMMGVIATPTIYLLSTVTFGVSLSVVLVIMGMAMYLGMPVVEAYIINHVPAQKRSTTLGIYYLASRGGPAIAPLIGYLISQYGFAKSFSVVGTAMAATTLICAILLWGRRD